MTLGSGGIGCKDCILGGGRSVNTRRYLFKLKNLKIMKHLLQFILSLLQEKTGKNGGLEREKEKELTREKEEN